MKTKLNISSEIEYSSSSQNGEDGIIQHIFKSIGTTNKVFVEIGVSASEGEIENNTFNLLNHGWTGYWFDFMEVGCVSPNCKFIKEKVTVDNVVGLFESAGIPKKIDILSIDIDSNDYYIREVLNEYSPSVYIMEYNGCYDSDTDYVMPRDDNYIWKGQRNFGASLKSLTTQANNLGYDLVYCDSRGINAFFIRKDINVFLPKTSKQAYILPLTKWVGQDEILRRQKINKLYEKILMRPADESGLFHYTHSNHSIEEIEFILKNSIEARSVLVNQAMCSDSIDNTIHNILFKNEHTQVEYIKHNIQSDKVVITFRGHSPELELNGFGFWGKKLFNQGYDIICFKTISDNCYEDVLEESYIKIENILKSYNLKYGIGISMGCYPMIKHSNKFKLNKAYGLSPRVHTYDNKTNKTFHLRNIDNVDNDCEYFMFNNFSNLDDNLELNYFLNYLPKENVKIYNVNDSNNVHGIIDTLYNNNIYLNFIESLFVEHKVLFHKLIQPYTNNYYET
jgi:hypothetical protein